MELADLESRTVSASVLLCMFMDALCLVSWHLNRFSRSDLNFRGLAFGGFRVYIFDTSSFMAGNKDGKDVGVPHEESQLQDSETNPPFEESQQLEDSQQDVEPPSQPNLSLPDSQETLKLSPNCVSPLPMPPSPSPSPQEEGEESSDGQASDDSANLTPPVGFCIASDGSVHGDMNMMGSMMADPMSLMIFNAMSAVIGNRLAAKGDGKGSASKGDGDGQGYDGASSSSATRAAQPFSKAKAKAKGSSKRNSKKAGKKNWESASSEALQVFMT